MFVSKVHEGFGTHERKGIELAEMNTHDDDDLLSPPSCRIFRLSQQGHSLLLS